MTQTISIKSELDTLIQQALEDQRAEAAIVMAPVSIKTGRSHEPSEGSQIMRQRCGGGYRVIKKKVGNN